MAGATIEALPYNSSLAHPIDWMLFSSGSANTYVNVNAKDASKLILLVSVESTKSAVGTTFYIGCSDSGATGSSYAKPYFSESLDRMKLTYANTTKGDAQTKHRCTGTTRLVQFCVLGPFEASRFKDSDGYINFCKAKTGSTTCFVAPILIPEGGVNGSSEKHD